MVSRSVPNLKVSITGRPATDASPPLSPRPLTAATRRRLRASLPPSPVGSRVPPPSRPVAWHWRCCSCRATYDLAVTQRCLACSHNFCSVNSHLQTSVGSIPKKKTTSRGSPNRRRVDRLGNPITCTTEFDYEGWAAYGAWRRRVTGTQITEDQRDRRYLLRAQDDWHHCDFPSQCAHRRRELRPIWQDILLSDASSDEENSLSAEKKKKKKKTRYGGKPSSELSDQQVLDLFDDPSDDEYAPRSATGLRVRNHGEPDWENFGSDDDDDDSDASDDEDLVDADGNLVRWRSSAGEMKRDVTESPVLLVKAVSSFWGAADF
ncbi:Subunit of heteropentameric Replication factor C (RF-C) [Pestalotiopsis sp. IQ-011]